MKTPLLGLHVNVMAVGVARLTVKRTLRAARPGPPLARRPQLSVA